MYSVLGHIHASHPPTSESNVTSFTNSSPLSTLLYSHITVDVRNLDPKLSTLTFLLNGVPTSSPFTAHGWSAHGCAQPATKATITTSWSCLMTNDLPFLKLVSRSYYKSIFRTATHTHASLSHPRRTPRFLLLLKIYVGIGHFKLVRLGRCGDHPPLSSPFKGDDGLHCHIIPYCEMNADEANH